LSPVAQGTIDPPAGGWYDTGDIVAIDGEGYVRILGRAKRFAKIAGEMVSLGAAENLATTVWPTFKHAVVALPDARKGEQIVLVTDNPNAAVEALLAEARRQGLAEVAVPRTLLTVPAVPLLATGKADYVAVSQLAREMLSAQPTRAVAP
jgi:acyl-[acyl-carrier-protein]-phospholipid O-acyltransferase / long-chain-fatty-acid--[acyl-carrier-protein] ligase